MKTNSPIRPEILDTKDKGVFVRRAIFIILSFVICLFIIDIGFYYYYKEENIVSKTITALGNLGSLIGILYIFLRIDEKSKSQIPVKAEKVLNEIILSSRVIKIISIFLK